MPHQRATNPISKTRSTILSHESAPFQAPELYQSYLLRFWQEQPHAPWRVAIQSVQSGELLHFAELQQLIAFLVTQTASPEPTELPAALSPEAQAPVAQRP